MSKRKRQPADKGGTGADPVDESSTDDASVKDDMVHVTPDVLAGSPDIFAAKKKDRPAEPAATADASEPVGANAPEMVSEPVDHAPVTPHAEEPELVESPAQPTEASTALTPAPSAVQAPPPAAPAMPPAHMPPAAHPAHPHRGGSSMALGIVLVVVGVFALVVVLAGVDLTQYGWPLFVIVPGLTLLIVGFAGVGAGATIPGGIITVLGLVLGYQNATGDWPSWAYAWALVIPGGLGLGMYLQALHDRDVPELRRGRSLMFAGVLIFIIGFVFFESILGISGRDYGIVGKAALPALLIIIGAILLVRSIQRSRRT